MNLIARNSLYPQGPGTMYKGDIPIKRFVYFVQRAQTFLSVILNYLLLHYIKLFQILRRQKSSMQTVNVFD